MLKTIIHFPAPGSEVFGEVDCLRVVAALRLTAMESSQAEIWEQDTYSSEGGPLQQIGFQGTW